MKNVLPVLALLLSVSGIAVSLGREEVRCYIGLESQACPREIPSESKPDRNETVPKDTAPTETTRVEPAPEVSPAPSPSPAGTEATISPSPEVRPESSPTAVTKEQEKTPVSEPSPEAVPSPQPTSESVPIEVVPPPESPAN